MKRTDAIIIGAGQAGLAMSRCLSDRGIDHVILERGRIAERWRSERWDSLRLLTPNWQSRLPGFRYDGPDPDGFMTMPEVIDYFERYAGSFGAPVESETTVVEVTGRQPGFDVITDRGRWRTHVVVVATGHSDIPFVPAVAAQLPRDIRQVVPTAYRRPDLLEAGGVLVVGASASGIQLAEEIHDSGRPVTLAVGHHTRVPRSYRGQDIMWWLDRTGILGETLEDVYDVDISREQPSFQLVGRADRATLDLLSLGRRGVRIVGRLQAVDGYRAVFADDLVATTAAADVKLAALLARLDAFASKAGLADLPDTEPFVPHWPAFVDAPATVDLHAAGIRTVVWATGFRRRYPWLKVPALDGSGEIRHRGGITPHAGLYVIGMHFLRRRNSSFIDGVGSDAAALAGHVAAHLDTRERAIA